MATMLPEYHPAVLASETTDYQANTLASITNALTYGAGSALASGALSIYNTVVDYAGGEGVNIEDAIRTYGGNTMGDYYRDNKDTIDLVGFVGTSLIPGSIGIKGLSLARTGYLGGNIAKYTALPVVRKNEYTRKALQEVAADGGVLKSILSSNQRKIIGWEMADQAMTAAAFELGVAALMNDSPIFDDAGVAEFAWNAALGLGFGTTVGTVFNSFVSRGLLRSAEREVQAQMRAVDILEDKARMSLVAGTDSLLLAESIVALPKTFDNLNFEYTTVNEAGKRVKTSIELETANKLQIRKEEVERLGQDKLKLKFNELAKGNENVGQAFYEALKDRLDILKQINATPAEQVQAVHGYLNLLESVRPVDAERMALEARKFYIVIKPEGLPKDQRTLKDMFSLKRMKGQDGKEITSKQAYYLSEGVTKEDLNIGEWLQVSGSFTNVKKYFAQHPNVDGVMMPDGTLRINRKSSKILKFKEDPVKFSMLADLESLSLSPEAVLAFGDIVEKGKLVFAPDAIYGGGKKFVQEASRKADIFSDPLESSARFAWASKLTASELQKIIGTNLDASDLPLLDRLIELMNEGTISDKFLNGVTFKTSQGDLSYADLVSLKNLAAQERVAILAEQLGEAGAKGRVPTTQELAIHMNSERRWVEDVISRGFTPDTPDTMVGQLYKTDRALVPRTVQLQWNFSPVSSGRGNYLLPEEAYNLNMGPNHLVTKEMSRQYQLEVARKINISAADSVLGDGAALIPHETDFLEIGNKLSRSASIQGAGASLLGASNAGYGDKAKLFVQELGKNVALLSQKFRDRTIETLSPNVNALRANQEASAELGVLTTALRKSEHKYFFAPFESGAGDNVLISETVGKILQDRKFTGSLDDAVQYASIIQPSRSPHRFDIKNQEVVDFLMTSTRINDIRQGKFTTLYNAAGVTKNHTAGHVYAPPINTALYPYHAFVRTKQKLGLGSDVSMIVARSEAQLRKLASEVSDDYDVFFKADTDNYFKAKGEYEYQNTLNETAVNSDLARRGVLADFYPETRLENIMNDWLGWHAKQEEKLVRNAVQVKNREFFSEMQFLSDQYRRVPESRVGGIGERLKAKISDPFGDYIKTALNISKQQEFPLLDSLNEFIDGLSIRAGEAMQNAFGQAEKGIVSWQEANQIAQRYGLPQPYQNIETYIEANKTVPVNVVREFFQKANAVLATTTLRFDFFNSLINIISTPIMLGTEMASVRRMMSQTPELAGKLAELTRVKVPGQNYSVPSTTKLISESVNNFFGANKDALMQRYKDIGAIKEISKIYHEMMDDLAYRPNIAPKEWVEKIKRGTEKAATVTGNNFSEDFTRFVSADVMRVMTDPLVQAGRMTIKEQNAYISTFVNRTQGNYVTSQRPIIFQGTVGAAVSLFQTYAFNVLQQLLRHMQAGDKKTLAVFAGLQSSIFGMNGLPFFDAVNTHLLGQWIYSNPEHKDLYSVLPSFNKELGDWMLYGTASAFPLFSGSFPALFTRGDINPRHITILPTNLVDVPAVSASLRLVGQIKELGANLVQGADVSEAMLTALEHQGWNRPLAGFAQVLAGKSTTSTGSLISAANELETTSMLAAVADRVVNYGGVTRVLGARPMNEAVALQALYREKRYEALDKLRIERLGEVVKTKLYNNEVPSDDEYEDFLNRYVRSGGRAETFNQAFIRWTRDANESVVNQMLRKNENPFSQKLFEIMGGEPLSD